ncbi:NACHT, LRR and PYD domains-containing protein 3-like isoform X2 [Alosa pseudoharengus]|uniref:NACHT, LRR and PYD domains-containing protein 3-like isoform X2 n=1 Tax=Alosa pseudoharengus TaxID=34774 RepID=UPI003F8AFA53
MERVSGPPLTQGQSRCGVCEQLPRDPLSISACGHSFCRPCLSSYWVGTGGSTCPRCADQHRAQLKIPCAEDGQGSSGPGLIGAPVMSSIATASDGGSICNPTFAGCQIYGPVTFNNETQSTRRRLSEKEQEEALLQEVRIDHKARMKKRFECIFEGIETKANKKLLNKIYTDLYITEVESEAMNDEHEVWQLETAFKKQSAQDAPINCNDIFKPLPGEEGNIRVVLTKGVAGMGKTVSVQKFVLDWAEGSANQNIRFMFVFPFRVLNSIKEKHSLQKLLLGFHPELKSLGDTNEYYDDSRTILIFDGLDESRLPLNFQGNEAFFDVSKVASVDELITNLIQGNLLPSALVWVTSRPAAACLIPTKYVDQMTEVRGFNEAQKEEYFRKRCEDATQAELIIAHIKTSRSLQVMCHIPVFCWIAATVFQQILKRTKEDNAEIPKTLTQMYSHFLLIQMSIKDQKYHGGHGGTDKGGLLSSHGEAVLKLAKLAFKQTLAGNVMFYEDDLLECGIDVNEASVYSGMCTELFREESVFYQQKVYCFVHLSIQEFLAAFHAFATHTSGNHEELKPLLRVRASKGRPRTGDELSLERFLKDSLYTALNSRNGHLDLFLRFLLGVTLESNQRLLRGLLPRLQSSTETVGHMIEYIKAYKGKGLSPERCINLFHCLVEMNDSSMHREIQEYLQLEGSRKALSSSFCSCLAHVLLMSGEVLDEVDLRKYNTSSDEGRRRLVPVVKCCRRALFSACNLNETSCEVMACALQSADCHLVEMDLHRNDLQDAGAERLFTAMLSPNCKLEILRISDCNMTEKSSGSLCSSLLSPHCRLRVLDMSGNQLKDSGATLICKGLKNPHCTLEILRLECCGLTAASCRGLASVLQRPGSALRELDLTDNDLRDAGAKLLSTGLGSSHCKLQILKLVGCLISEEGCLFLASALKSNPSHLLELDLSYNHPGNSGAELLTATPIDPGSTPRAVNVDHGAACRLTSGLQKYACNLTFDPNTAHRKLCLSEDNRSVACNMREQAYPDHPDRFSTWQVLCREPLSRRSYWEVEWSGWYGVVIGASYKVDAGDSPPDVTNIGYNDWSWSLACYDNRYVARHDKRRTEIPAPVFGAHRIAAYLNWPAGTLSFFSVSGDALTHVHTFYSRFSEQLYPAMRFIFAGSSASIL